MRIIDCMVNKGMEEFAEICSNFGWTSLNGIFQIYTLSNNVELSRIIRKKRLLTIRKINERNSQLIDSTTK